MAKMFIRSHGIKLLESSTTLAHCFSLPAWYLHLPASFSPSHYRLQTPRLFPYSVSTFHDTVKPALTKTSRWLRYLNRICMLGDFCQPQTTFNTHSHFHQGQRPRVHGSVHRRSYRDHVLFRHQYLLGHGDQYIIRHTHFAQ